MTFDYETCMKRDGGKALYQLTEVGVVSSGFHHEGEWLYAVRSPSGGVFIVRESDDLRNITPPKPKLKPVDAVWWRTSDGDVFLSLPPHGEVLPGELRRITVDPNALTPDEFAEHQVFIERAHNRHRQSWRFWQQGTFAGEYKYETHAAACLAATEWLRTKGVIE